MNIDLLDAALGNTEKLYASLRAFRDLCGEISDFQQEAQRAKADAEEAKRSLAKLNAEVAAAQTTLDELRAERAAAEERVQALAAEHTQLTASVNSIRALLKGAA
jgi:chromosome segregation ATPase